MRIDSDVLETFLDGPDKWPRWAGRAYVVTLPISFPALIIGKLIVCAVVILIGGPIMLACFAGSWVRDLWTAE